MSRTLVVIAVAGFALCALFFTLAFMIAGGQIFRSEKPLAAIKPLTDLATRKEWRWDGGDSLTVNAPVVLHYQPDGPERVMITGPANLLQHVRVGAGQIGSDTGHALRHHRDRNAAKLDAVVSGMPIRRFIIDGNEQLQLGHINQERLEIRINDSGSVSAEGRVGQLNIIICGSGRADLGKLSAQDVKVAILGPGDAILAPVKSLFLTIAGPGVVRLASHPSDIQKTIIGPGRLIEAGDVETAPVPPMPPPAPSSMPPAPPVPPAPPGAPEAAAAPPRNFLFMGSELHRLGHLDGGAVKMLVGGSGSVSADGKVDRLILMVSGAGNARLGGLSARRADVTVTGSGNATIAPRDEAHVTILGSGNVYLASRPRALEQNRLGSGHVIERNCTRTPSC